MLTEFFSSLMMQCIAVGAICFWIASRQMPMMLAFWTTCIRLAIPYMYFTGVFGPGWTLFDDLSYLNQAYELSDLGFSPITSLLDPQSITTMMNLAGSSHFIYAWWNLLAISLFGEHYHAPVLLNIIATFITGHYFARTLTLLGFDRSYRIAAHVFILVHWDITSWTSLLNLKDPLVQTLTAITIYQAVCFYQRRSLRSLVMCAACLTLFHYLRFYTPYLLVIAAAITLLCHWRHPAKYITLGLISIGFWYFAKSYEVSVQNALHPEGLGYGALRMMLIPQPWSLDEGYSFLLISSVLHWVFFVPMVLGFFMIWKECPQSRFTLTYLAVVMAFYSATQDFQGPRQRLQISFLLAWAQIHFLYRCQRRTRQSLSGESNNRVISERFDQKTIVDDDLERAIL